jgi:uncharacterized membrane protein YcaP (DUF421 family)
MALYKILLRIVFAYIFLVVMMRLAGKRPVAQGSTFDLVVALIIGDMFDDMFWAEVPASKFVVAAGVVMLAHIGVSIGSYANETFSWLASGRPTKFLRGGSLLKAGQRGEQISVKEAAAMLRKQRIGPDEWAEVKSARIERSGQPSILKREWAREAQKQDADRLREVVR